MKSLATYLFGSAVCLATAAGLYAHEVTLGDPVPVDSGIVLVHGRSSCNSCQPTLGFQACCDQAKGCSGCKETIVSVACPTGCQAPHCACSARPTPCKACDAHKRFRHAPATPCATCGSPAPCKTCAAPACAPAPVRAPAPCTACESRKIVHHHAPACTTCAPAPAPSRCKSCTAPAPAACKPCAAPARCTTCAKPAPCTTCSTPAPAPCKSCDSCKAAKPVHSRPILDGFKRFFNGSGGHHHAKCDACSTCSTCQPAAQPAAQPAPQQPAQPVPQPHVPRPVAAPATTQIPVSGPASYQQMAPVPAAHAPNAGPSTFSTAVPEVR